MTDNVASAIVSQLNTKNLILKILRFCLFLFYLSCYILTFFIIRLSYRDLWKRRAKIAKSNSFYARLALKMMGFKIHTQKVKLDDSVLIVSNHLSYTDVLIIASCYPCVFVTSVEIKETPGLGQLTELGGCLYVERRNKSNIHNEIIDITNGLKRGLNVCIFPEATSTNGDSVLRFRSPLFQAAINSGRSILTLCMNYKKLADAPIDRTNRDTIAWYDDMTFLPHLLGVMGTKTIDVNLDHGAVITTAETDDPKNLAQIAQQEVEKLFISLNR